MSDGDELAGCVGAMIGLAVVVAVAIMAVMALMSIGALFGAGTALRNYGLAFQHNIKPQRVTS
jgi:hypothetical protein